MSYIVLIFLLWALDAKYITAILTFLVMLLCDKCLPYKAKKMKSFYKLQQKEDEKLVFNEDYFDLYQNNIFFKTNIVFMAVIFLSTICDKLDETSFTKFIILIPLSFLIYCYVFDYKPGIINVYNELKLSLKDEFEANKEEYKEKYGSEYIFIKHNIFFKELSEEQIKEIKKDL